jgi:hypothetical protein
MFILKLGSEEDAALVTGKLSMIFGELEDLIRLVDERSNKEQSHAFRQAVGVVCGDLVLDLLAPLYRGYPQLRPDSWPQDE